MQQERSSSAAIALVWYYAPYFATARRSGVQMMSIVLLRPFVIATERSTDRPCTLDMFDTTRSFTHMFNTCVIGRLAFLNTGFIDLLSGTRSLTPSTTWHQRVLICPRTSKSWDCSKRSWGFPNDCDVRRLGNRGCSKKSMKSELVWLMIAFITCNSNLVPLLEGLCSSNQCRFEFLVFWVFAGSEPTTSGLTVLRSDQLS